MLTGREQNFSRKLAVLGPAIFCSWLLLPSSLIYSQCALCNAPPPPVAGSEVGGSSVQNVGVLSVQGGRFHDIGLAQGKKQIGIFLNRTSLRIKKINGVPLKISRRVDSATLSGGMGLTDRLSLWGQLPLVEDSRVNSWQIGDPALGFRWGPFSTQEKSRFILFFNQGFVFPLNKTQSIAAGGASVVENNISNALLGQGVYLNRSVAETWINYRRQRAFGAQLSWEFSLNENRNGFNPGRVLQLSLHTIDYRFARAGIVPYIALVYRNEKVDRLGGQNLENSAGWFIQGIAALNARISRSYHATVSISGPIITGLDGTDLKQLNIGIALWRLLG